MLRFCLFLLLLFVTAAEARSNDIIGTREGLSNRYVTCIRQGKDGLIWIGTKNGLNIYDGYSFKTYFTYSDEFPLSNATINNLLVQSDGTLYVGTLAGLNILPSGTKKPFVLLRDKNIISSCLSSRHTVFVSTSEGDIFEIDDTYHAAKILTGKGPCTLMQVSSGNRLWFCMAPPKKMYAFNFSTRKLTQPVQDEIKGFYHLFSDTIMVYALNKGLSLFNARTGLCIPDQFLDSLSRIYTNPGIICRDRKGYFWINYGYGTLLKISLSKRRVENYSHYFNHSYFGGRITSIFEDQSGMMWVGTEGGFLKISQPASAFKHYLVNNEVNGAEEYISARGILSDSSNNLYFATYKGLYFLNRQTQQQKCFLLEPDKFSGSVQPSPHQMLWLDRHKLLITSYTKGLLEFNTVTGRFDPAVADYDSSVKQLLGLFKDAGGVVWVGSFRGVYQYDKSARRLIQQKIHYKKNNSITGIIWCFAQDHQKNIWIGSNSGLYKIAPHSQTATRYHTFSSPALSNNEIVSILVDRDSSLWLGSKGGGLSHFNLRSDSITVYNTADGLSDNIVYGILPDEDNYLWLSTESGLARFDKKSHGFQNYYERDGINSNEFNAGSYYKMPDGELFFGGINGVISFFPSRLNDIVLKPEIILTELSTNNEHIAYAEDAGSEVFLPYDAKFLSLRFALTDFYESQFNTFYYKIEGLDDHWTRLGSQNFLRITNLPAGSYELLVKGSNMNGIESSNTIRIKIRVGQVFYKETWFIILCMLLVATGIYLITRFRIDQLLQLQKLRIKIASDLHDEMGSMLTRISILTELLKYQKLKNPEIDQIASVSRMATATMSDVLWSIDARNDKIGNLIDRMRDHADTMLIPIHKNVVFTSESIDTNTPMGMQVRQNLLLIFKEAINNIAKHSNATEVAITFYNRSQSIMLSIKDNGSGIRLNENGQGLKNMEMRAKEMGASLKIETSHGFSISISLN